MPIDYRRVRNLSARQLIRALLRDGFELRRQTGSHRHYVHEDGRRVTLPFHRSSDTFRASTLRSIIGLQAQWAMDDLTRLGLVK